MVRAWIIDPKFSGDQRQPGWTDPIQEVSLESLAKLGVLYWKVSTEGAEADPISGRLGEIRKERNYKNHDVIQIHPDKLPNYEAKIKMFYEEHIHEDEEIRFCLEGSGYFDVRSDIDNSWIRVAVEPGDMLVLPAGIYHRFTTDEKNYIKAMRLFQDLPKWEAHNRSPKADKLLARAKYLQFVAQSFGQVEMKEGPNGTSYTLTNGALPKSLANYPHVRKANGFLYVSGFSSRQPDNSFRGVSTDGNGQKVYDIAEQTRGVLDNIAKALAVAGATLAHVVDLQAFLVDMKDFTAYNEAYNEYFDAATGPTRTTIAVHQLPHPDIRIEIKVVAVDPFAKSS